MFDEDDLLPVSALQHFMFCPRRCALVHMPTQYSASRARSRLASVRTMESCEGSWSGLRRNTSTAITDSLRWLSLPSRCRSVRNLRNRLIRSFRRNPGLARTRSNCRRAPVGSVGAMGMDSSIHLVFSDVQMYETHFQPVRTCSFFPPGASWEPDWVAKRDPIRRGHENSI